MSRGRYQSLKEKVRARDGYTCQICGCNAVQVHHIFGKEKYGGLGGTPDNCIVLCARCHKKYHQLYTGEDINPYTFVQFMKQQRRAII